MTPRFHLFSLVWQVNQTLGRNISSHKTLKDYKQPYQTGRREEERGRKEGSRQERERRRSGSGWAAWAQPIGLPKYCELSHSRQSSALCLHVTLLCHPPQARTGPPWPQDRSIFTVHEPGGSTSPEALAGVPGELSRPVLDHVPTSDSTTSAGGFHNSV